MKSQLLVSRLTQPFLSTPMFQMSVELLIFIYTLLSISVLSSDDIAASIAVALVQSRLDYANSLLYHTSAYNINKLQRVQNMAARLVLRKKHTSIIDSITHLHWLPISKRIDFKIATITYKLLSTQQPPYLTSLIRYHDSVRQLL